MLQPVQNKDIEETTFMADQANLEDAIFLTADKLQALCTIQSQMETNECLVSNKTRSHYALIIEEQVNELRELLEQHFSGTY